jgi:hypothetical protein
MNIYILYVKNVIVLFRIKMCFRDTVDDVYTMHKQLGLVHYFSAYKIQPIIFQHTSDAG